MTGRGFRHRVDDSYVAHNYAQNHPDLVARLDAGNPLLIDRLAHPGSSVVQGYWILELQVNWQAYLFSYLDTSQLIRVFFALVLVLTFCAAVRIAVGHRDRSNNEGPGVGSIKRGLLLVAYSTPARHPLSYYPAQCHFKRRAITDALYAIGGKWKGQLIRL